MGLHEEQGKRGGVRAPLTALALLLLLLVHAFAVTTLHAHTPRGLNLKSSAERGPVVRDDRPADNATSAGRHAQCLLCNLQRDFVTDLGQLSPVAPATAPRPVRRATRESEPHEDESYLSPGGRAPPPAHNS